MYPHIVSLRPANGGVNNLGFGKDTQNQEYLLKAGAQVCIAEFVGAALCEAVGIEHCQPKVVTMTNLDGAKVHVFGSVLEPSLLNFNMRDIAEWQTVLAMMPRSPFFTKVLAVDLSLGNDDRHQDNWLVRAPSKDSFQHEMLAMDFSNSWPVCIPPHHPRKHPAPNTWRFVRLWSILGITFDHEHFRSICAKISSLDSAWIAGVLTPLVGIWLTHSDQQQIIDWWNSKWQAHLIDVINALETDGDWQ
ncbi:hypothetical protein [Variovorax sp. PMC12]|uniref:hypothetical protein n=1 Tax=Variovorax sp. PMC12 TaxID=2126319 RepID=UPI00131D4250|nr:hypothetical protein [Variovorax sp. PMC12]